MKYYLIFTQPRTISLNHHHNYITEFSHSFDTLSEAEKFINEYGICDFLVIKGYPIKFEEVKEKKEYEQTVGYKLYE